MVLLGVVSFGIWSLVWSKPLQQSSAGQSPARLPVYGSVPDFALIDQRGRPVRRADLDGKVWIANFIFTNCPDECPLMTSEMAQLQSDLAHSVDLRFVSISVDPERDTPAVLSQYAERFNADPDRWFFLTGDKRAIYRLAREGFRLGIVDPVEPSHASPVKGSAPSGVEKFRGPTDAEQRWAAHKLAADLPRYWLRALEPTAAFADHGRAKDTLHSTRFVLIDRLAQIRGYYESREEAALAASPTASPDAVPARLNDMFSLTDLPALNATLNATSAILLTAGYRFIRRRQITAHKRCMLAACAMSALFLVSYLTYHYYVGSMPFRGQGWVRPLYFTILDLPYDPGGYDCAPGRRDPLSRLESRFSQTCPSRPLDVADLAIRVGDGRDHLCHALPALSTDQLSMMPPPKSTSPRRIEVRNSPQRTLISRLKPLGAESSGGFFPRAI